MSTRAAFVFVAFVLALFGSVEPRPAQAADLSSELIREAGDTQIDAFLWTARPIVVFADTPADPRFKQQMDILMSELEELEDRDVVILTDTNPANQSPIRSKLRPRGFQMVLIGKDGGVKLRKPFPYSVREISRTIDKTPLRLQEIRDRRAPLDQ